MVYYPRSKKTGRLIHRQIAYHEIYLPNRDKYPLPFSEYEIHHKRYSHPVRAEDLEIVTPEEHATRHPEHYSESNSLPGGFTGKQSIGSSSYSGDWADTWYCGLLELGFRFVLWVFLCALIMAIIIAIPLFLISLLLAGTLFPVSQVVLLGIGIVVAVGIAFLIRAYLN